MTQKQLKDSVLSTFSDAASILNQKNQDYSVESDALKNFKIIQMAGVTINQAILVRIFDKLARISNTIDSQVAVKEESVEDSILDAINYLAILRAAIQDAQKDQ